MASTRKGKNKNSNTTIVSINQAKKEASPLKLAEFKYNYCFY